MKLKYYLRGLGIGVVVTTIILAIALNNKPMELTDAQIKERAAEFGMVEKEAEAEKETKATEPTTAPETKATTTKETTTKATTTKATTTAPATAAPTTTQAATQAQQQAAKPADGTVITMEIGTYDWSNHVAEKFEEAGLIESASDFDRYLINSGYESKIRSGVHSFTMGASYEELAKELVSSPD